MIHAQTGHYPRSIAAMVRPQDADGNLIPGGLKKHPTDPWGDDYDYETSAEGPAVRCRGRERSAAAERQGADLLPANARHGGSKP